MGKRMTLGDSETMNFKELGLVRTTAQSYFTYRPTLIFHRTELNKLGMRAPLSVVCGMGVSGGYVDMQRSNQPEEFLGPGGVPRKPLCDVEDTT